MTENFRPTSLRTQAREALRGKWGNAALVSLIFCVIISAFIGLAGGFSLPTITPNLSPAELSEYMHGYVLYFNKMLVLNIFLGSFISLGMIFLFLDVARGAEVKMETLFEAFKKYGRYLLVAIIVIVFTWLWSLLFIIPGFIKSISYSMTYFIMRENPEMSPNDARKLSMKMMHGHKMELFLLELSFFGWALLCGVTLGIGLLWLIPYMYTSMGRFWETLKAESRA